MHSASGQTAPSTLGGLFAANEFVAWYGKHVGNVFEHVQCVKNMLYISYQLLKFIRER
jgi:hypothetical protein